VSRSVGKSKGAITMTRVERIVSELWRRGKAEGNGFEITLKKDGTKMWIWFQNNGKYAIYFDDGNIWRDTSDVPPVIFDSLEDMAMYIMSR
jgi:hypothetical protein